MREPIISNELMEYLDSLYPDVSPEPEWTDRAIWIRRGEVGVVRHLKRLHKDQSENILNGDQNYVLRR